jgi:TonB family protein
MPVTRTVRPKRRRDHVGWRLLFALALSLAVNGLLLWLAILTGAFEIGKGVRIVSPVALAPLSASDWERNRAAPPPRPPPVARPPPQAPPPSERPGQVVELPPETPGARNERPADARFLAERNQTVEKETVSKYARGHAGNVLLQPQQGSPGAPAPTPKQPAPGPKVASAQRPKGAPDPGGQPSSEWRLQKQGAADGVEGLAARLGPRGGGGPPGPEQLDLSVTPETIARIGGAPNMDGYGEVQEGEITSLNTREFKYATYMNQIRRRIGEAWYPKVDEVVRARDPEGKSFFYKQRAVTLSVILDTSGRVSDIQVTRSSNIDFFDRLAISSVKQAQPFLNPPPGLFDPDGYARIPFGFILYPSEHGGTTFWRPPTGE